MAAHCQLSSQRSGFEDNQGVEADREQGPKMATLDAQSKRMYSSSRPRCARTFEDQQAAAVALSERLQQTRHSIDEEIRAIARGLKPPALAGFKFKIKRFLPPLLRLEIVRDFMQTLSLFFTHLYFTARDRADIDGFSEVMEKIQDGLRYVYNFAAADFPALYANFDVKKLMQNKTLIDAAFVFLLLFVGISYLLYLWFCFIVWCNWTTERQIRELDATTKQRRPFIKRVTLVLTICLSIYLPTMRLSIEILGGSSDTSVVRRRYENIDHWLWLQIAAIIFLATFTLPLPLLLAVLFRKHKPKTLPHKPESTYNLDGDVIPMDINVYAHKIAHDPDQLQCPYRSLYEGLEREWCYYKIFQLVSKAVLVLLVLFIPGEQLRNALTLAVCVTVSFFTFRWKPFIDPLNDQMEICGKATALLTCIKGVLVSTKRIDKKRVSAFGFLVNAASILNSIFMAAGCVYGIEFVRALIKDTFGRLKFSDTVRCLEDKQADGILPHWDLDREIRRRVWQHFWKSLLLSLDEPDAIKKLTFSEHELINQHAHHGK